MARIIGGVATTHVPSIGKAIAEKKQNDPYWKPFFKGFDYVHYWLAREKPDVAVVFYNDHGLNFFLDKLPTFAVGAADEYRNEDEGWGIPVSRAIAGDPALSWHLINALVADEFDITMCQDMLVDHAVTIPMTLMWPGQKWSIKIVPVSINTVQHPLPSLKRCLELGRSIGRAVESYKEDLRVMMIGTGGLSHQLDGKRAGFINKEFDQLCMDKLVDEPETLARYSIHDWVEEAGAQGVEFLNWMAMRGALTGRVTQVHRNYHIPISNTAAATVVLENHKKPNVAPPKDSNDRRESAFGLGTRALAPRFDSFPCRARLTRVPVRNSREGIGIDRRHGHLHRRFCGCCIHAGDEFIERPAAAGHGL